MPLIRIIRKGDVNVKIIGAIDKILDSFEKWLSVFLLLGLIAVVFVQVILRAVGIPFSGADETSRLLFVWCMFLGAAHASRNRKHLKIDIVSSLVKNETFRSVLNIVEDLAVMIFAIIFIPVAGSLIIKFIESGQQSPVLHYNVAIAYAAPAVFFVLAAVRHFENVLREIAKMVQSKHKGKGAIA